MLREASGDGLSRGSLSLFGFFGLGVPDPPFFLYPRAGFRGWSAHWHWGFGLRLGPVGGSRGGPLGFPPVGVATLSAGAQTRFPVALGRGT